MVACGLMVITYEYWAMFIYNGDDNIDNVAAIIYVQQQTHFTRAKFYDS